MREGGLGREGEGGRGVRGRGRVGKKKKSSRNSRKSSQEDESQVVDLFFEPSTLNFALKTLALEPLPSKPWTPQEHAEPGPSDSLQVPLPELSRWKRVRLWCFRLQANLRFKIFILGVIVFNCAILIVVW